MINNYGRKEYSRILLQQAEQFGIENRMNQVQEEMSELSQAICKCRRSLDGDRTLKEDIITIKHNITEEIADVEICLKQLKHLLGNKEQVEHIKVQKIVRTEQRLNKNEYKEEEPEWKQRMMKGFLEKQ